MSHSATNITERICSSAADERVAPALVAAENSLPSIVSLFCGAGGLDWGFHSEGFQIPLAIDISTAAIRTHKRNFPCTHSLSADLNKLKPGGVSALAREIVKPKSLPRIFESQC